MTHAPETDPGTAADDAVTARTTVAAVTAPPAPDPMVVDAVPVDAVLLDDVPVDTAAGDTVGPDRDGLAMRLRPPGGWSDDRGDVPGWVLVTLMTAGLVIALWAIAGPALQGVFESAIERVTSFGG